MVAEYPNDADGDALRRLVADGNDMAAPMVIDFPVVLPTEAAAQQFAVLAAAKSYAVQIWQHDDDSDWDVICAIEMVPTYADVVRIQAELSELAEPFGGICDSWGSFGNRENDKDDADSGDQHKQ